MFLFSFLWIPFFLLFWRAISPDGGGNAGAVSACIIGFAIGIFQFFADSLIFPGDFGLFRWLHGFIDLIIFPILIPLGLCLVFFLLNVFSGELNITNFLLISLIPLSILRTLNYGNLLDPLRLMVIPLIWTSLAVGIPLFIRLIQNEFGTLVILGIFSCIALPFLAATAYWALFCQKLFLGLLFLIPTMAPMFVSVLLYYFKSSKRGS